MNTTITKGTVSGVSVYASYVFAGLLHLMLLRFQPGPFVPLSKVFLMPLLMLAVFRQTTAVERKTTAMKMLLGALLLSGLGRCPAHRRRKQVFFGRIVVIPLRPPFVHRTICAIQTYQSKSNYIKLDTSKRMAGNPHTPWYPVLSLPRLGQSAHTRGGVHGSHQPHVAARPVKSTAK